MNDIVVVDDDGLLRSLVVDWLSADGYQVREAPDGDAALALLRTEPADLLITDMQMPRRDGVQTLSQLRDELPGMRVIAISGQFHSGRGVSVQTALSLGASRCLSKPFTREDLLAAVREVVDAR